LLGDNLNHDFGTVKEVCRPSFMGCQCKLTSGQKGIDSNIRHEAIPVPSGCCPFGDEDRSLFERGFEMLKENGDLPNGYGVTAAELGEGGFDDQEEINFGLNKKGYPIELPTQIWKPRTEVWAKGLFVMNSILALSS
jgi:hypothetical protein